MTAHRTGGRRSPARPVAVGLLAAMALIAGACSSADDDGDGVAGDTTPEASAPSDTAGPSDTTSSTDTEGPSDTEGPGDTEDPDSADPTLLPPGESHVTDDEGEPVHGGTLVYGIEADTANPWAPYRASTATSAFVMLASVSDPLFYPTAEGEIAPVLVESFDHNDDYTEWTYTIREGISFHDGTPLDGAAVEFNLETCQFASLWGAAFAAVSDISSEGQTVTITTNGPAVAQPWLTSDQGCAYMFSPDWLGSLADVPQRNEALPVFDEDLAATPADGDPAQPVGLGAFVLESYTPGNGNGFTLVRNDDYWRGPNGITGEELPYLDGIEAVIATDTSSRTNGLQSGQFDVIHTSSADAISDFLDDDSFETSATSLYGDTNHIQFNMAEGEIDPDGVNAASSLLNVHCRRALAHATDRERLVDEQAAGLLLVANGPFGPGSMGYLEDSGFPAYDPALANDEADTCLSELGSEAITFAFTTTNDPLAVEQTQLMISMWQEVLGDKVEVDIASVEQGQFIGMQLTGMYNAASARRFSGLDPTAQIHWWHSASTAPVGTVSLNLGHFRDDVIDEALGVVQTNPDPAARTEAAQAINRRFGEQVYNLWTSWTLWGIVSSPYVNGVEANDLPDGEQGVGLAFAGRHQTNQMWCDEGACE